MSKRKLLNIYIYIKQIIFFVVMILCCFGISQKTFAYSQDHYQGNQGYSSISITTNGSEAIVTYYNFYTSFYYFACDSNGGSDDSYILVKCPGYKIYGSLKGASRIYGGSVKESKAAERITINASGDSPLADGKMTNSDGKFYNVQPVLGTLEIHVINGANASSLPIAVEFGGWCNENRNSYHFTYPTIDKSMTVQMHTHSYTKKVVDKQATCTSAGSGHYECPTDGAKNGATYTIPALGHSFGSWSAWANSSNTEQKRTRTCSRCGKVETETKTRTYVVDLNIYGPNGNQVDPVDGGYGFGSVQLSVDNKSWSNDLRNEGAEPRLQNRHYQDKIYIKYSRPKYDYLEFCIIRGQNDTGTYTLPTVKEGENIWYYTVSPWTTTSAYTGGNINVYMQYKHTTLTLDPMGGFINNNTEVKTLSPQMQYSTNTWYNLSGQKPTRYGYTFEGWYDAATGGTKVYNVDGSCVRSTKYFDSNGNSLCVNDLTVYAHWTPTTYNIYYTLFGSAASIKRTYTIETDSFTLPVPTLSGYIFKGWVGGVDRSDPVYKETNIDSSEIRKTININKGSYGDRFYRAIFEKAHSVDDAKNRTDDIYIAQSKPKEEQILAVRVDFDLNLPIPENGRALTVKANPSYIKSIYYRANDFYMDPQYKIQSPILKDYIFLGWYTEREGGAQITSGLRVINTENHTLYAHWKPQDVKILSLSGNDISLKTGTSADINVNATFDDTKTWVGKDNDVWVNNNFFTHVYGINNGMVASIHAPVTENGITSHNIDNLQKDFKVYNFNQTTGQSSYFTSTWFGPYYSTNVTRGKKYHMEFDYMVNDDNIPIRCGIENGWNIIINPGKYTVSGIPSVSASANEWHHISKDFIYNNTIDNYHAFIIYAYARSTWCKDPLLWDNFSFKIKNMHFQEYESADATDYIAEWEYKSADGNWQKMNLQNVTESGTTLQIANADKTLDGTKVRLKMYNNAGKYKVSNEITIHVE